MGDNGSEVRVFVRIRPTASFAQELIHYLPDGQTINIRQRRDSKRGVVNNQLSSWSFPMNGVLHDVSQEDVYNTVAHKVVLGALEGYNGTVMCFGQTGAGKTFTMTGATESYKQRGLIPRAIQQVFSEVENRQNYSFTIHLSYLEIYNEMLVDLLSSVRGTRAGLGGLAVVEEAGGGVSVKGLSLHSVHNEEEALNLLFEGEMNRIIGSHAMNKNSSRSHCIFTIYIESRSRTLSDARYITSKLHLVDLAGSERLGKTGSEGQVQKEAMCINRSLSFLEQAILALADRRREHVPFRQSKLTHALRDSLGGNCNTVLVANIYGEAAQIEETLSTLRFASRMKCIKTEPAVNEHIDPVVQVKKLQKEIQLLKEDLAIQSNMPNRVASSYEPLSDSQVAEIQDQVQRFLDGSLEEISIVNIRQVKEAFKQFKLAVQQQEQKVRDELSQNYSLVEKPQSTPGAAADKARGAMGTMGEVEGCGFGVGVATSSQRHTDAHNTSKNRTKKGKENQGGPGKQTNSGQVIRRGSAQRNTDQPSDQTSQDHQVPASPSLSCRDQSINESPPPKEEAFEDFKAECGSELNRILRENKAVLLERRAHLRELTDSVNATKRQIDQAAVTLRQRQEHRDSQGQFVGSDGEPVLDEAEVTLVLKLRDLKAQYRQDYQDLCGTRAEVSYCQHLVDQCRVRLLTEFESWYNESFMLPEEVQGVLRAGGTIRPGLVPVEKALALEEDEQERFERMRYKLLDKSPSAVSFYNAHIRTVRRRSSNKSQAGSPRRNSTPARRMKLPPILSVT
ncbi:kinesin-like protein KIF9 isoform X1 [Alosa sapidissima]|uniref:kinesin-like protein KIF9 isoform X1 n=1 Tax=Alosa sapidissima TaxID=34773 RepID=UPI001C093630|nr:kinesin-like protein KIF9 isoform X1 [Alosa sapidissima]XP_041923868.1 kinesin-like protein KIF9 isoform X1 [Alosa sapidissima]